MSGSTPAALATSSSVIHTSTAIEVHAAVHFFVCLSSAAYR
jgi:hypothetical protein